MAKAGHADLASKVQVSDAASFLDDPEKALSTLRSGVPVLLSTVTAQQKETLHQHIGLRLEGQSDFLFIMSKPDKNGQPCQYVADTGDLSAVGPPETGMAEGQGNLNPETGPGRGSAELAAESDSAAPSPEPASESDPLQVFCDGAARILSYSPSTGNEFPPNAVYATWYYNRGYPWSCPQATKWNNFQPQAQNTYGTVDYKIQAFLDEVASGSYQWVYFQTLGFWTTGDKGMNYNAYNQKGWAIGTVGMKVAQPDGFNPIDMSPVNTNNQTQVTSTTSFQVDLSTDAGGGSYNVSNSQTNTISEWGVTLDTLNKWTFRQYQKFNGATKSFPDSEVYYSAGNVRYELYGLPDLSTKVFNFCTMSVFRNNQVQTGTVYLNPTISCQYFYIAISTSWPSWSGDYWWCQYPGFTDSLGIDLTLVSKPKPS
jgi:hypothetical protein